jgi:hypothetical protein
MAQQATDSFVTEVDGAPMFVTKGEILPDSHPVVKVLKDTHLFRSLVEEKAPKAPATAKAAT